MLSTVLRDQARGDPPDHRKLSTVRLLETYSGRQRKTVKTGSARSGRKLSPFLTGMLGSASDEYVHATGTEVDMRLVTLLKRRTGSRKSLKSHAWYIWY